MKPVGTLATLGYLDANAREKIEAFLAQPRSYLVDIRLTPYSRFWPKWNRPALRARYGRRYVHLRGLGNVHYQDRTQPIHLLDPESHIQHLAEQISRGTSYLLLCACKDYEHCHRKAVYEQIMLTLVRQPEGKAEATGAVYALSLWE